MARIPIVCVFEWRAAGFIAGSIPIKGTSYFALNSLIALVVAVLHATTIILQLLFNYMFLPEIVNHFVVFIKKNRLKRSLVAF